MIKFFSLLFLLNINLSFKELNDKIIVGAERIDSYINLIKDKSPNCTVEVLTPDFRGYKPALKKVFSSKPHIFSHNIECVERISKEVKIAH